MDVRRVIPMCAGNVLATSLFIKLGVTPPVMVPSGASWLQHECFAHFWILTKCK
jgi:hypothetical protein